VQLRVKGRENKNKLWFLKSSGLARQNRDMRIDGKGWRERGLGTGGDSKGFFLNGMLTSLVSAWRGLS